MEVSTWISVASAVISLGATIFAWQQARSAKRQALAAEEQNELIRQQLARADLHDESIRRNPWKLVRIKDSSYELVNNSDWPAVDVWMSVESSVRFEFDQGSDVQSQQRKRVILGFAWQAHSDLATVSWHWADSGVQHSAEILIPR